MPQAYTLLLEGSIQIITAIVLFITVKRRGKNRLLTTLAWLFLSVGIFSLGPFIPVVVSAIPVIAGFAAFSSLLCHTSIFFGLSGYCSAQIGLLKGKNAGRAAFALGLIVAAFLLVVHILSLQPVTSHYINAENVKMFESLAETTMFFFFTAAIIYVVVIFFSLSWYLRKQKSAAGYSSITGAGLTLMLISLLIRKVLDTIAPNIGIDALTFVSMGLVVAGAIIQATHSMSPGTVYDAVTKKPINMAIVRMIRLEDQKLLESRVTGEKGRYGIVAEPGKYTLDVTATGYSFPTKGQTGYTGEILEFTSPTLLGVDIPLTPA